MQEDHRLLSLARSNVALDDMAKCIQMMLKKCADRKVKFSEAETQSIIRALEASAVASIGNARSIKKAGAPRE